jgi:hypothetical protein
LDSVQTWNAGPAASESVRPWPFLRPVRTLPTAQLRHNIMPKPRKSPRPTPSPKSGDGNGDALPSGVIRAGESTREEPSPRRAMPWRVILFLLLGLDALLLCVAMVLYLVAGHGPDPEATAEVEKLMQNSQIGNPNAINVPPPR